MPTTISRVEVGSRFWRKKKKSFLAFACETEKTPLMSCQRSRKLQWLGAVTTRTLYNNSRASCCENVRTRRDSGARRETFHHFLCTELWFIHAPIDCRRICILSEMHSHDGLFFSSQHTHTHNFAITLKCICSTELSSVDHFWETSQFFSATCDLL